MTTPSPKAPVELTAWMRQRLALIRRDAEKAIASTPDVDLVIVPLARHWSEPGSRDDRSCDRCGAYVPEGVDLVLVHLHVAPWLHVVGGLCQSCHLLEVGTAPAGYVSGVRR